MPSFPGLLPLLELPCSISLALLPGRAQVREGGCSAARLQPSLNTAIQRQFPNGAGTHSVQRLPLALPANLLSCSVPSPLPLMNSLFHCNSYIKHLETRLVQKKKKKRCFSIYDLSRSLSERQKEFSWISKLSFFFFKKHFDQHIFLDRNSAEQRTPTLQQDNALWPQLAPPSTAVSSGRSWNLNQTLRAAGLDPSRQQPESPPRKTACLEKCLRTSRSDWRSGKPFPPAPDLWVFTALFKAPLRCHYTTGVDGLRGAGDAIGTDALAVIACVLRTSRGPLHPPTRRAWEKEKPCIQNATLLPGQEAFQFIQEAELQRTGHSYR